jgi:Rrf2 family cysteine metabolism transcriptional repressor
LKVSAKTEYACIAMLELAASYGSGEPVRIRKIAEQHGIPSRFLVQILLQLKGAGLVTSTRGAAGGYQLIKSPREVSLATVMSVIEGPEERLTSNTSRRSAATDVLVGVWQQASDAARRALDSVTFADLVERAGSRSGSMYYI